ncbi:hypothetical protein WN48_11084 [Eufriesea mexicana]|uniref:Circadian clock-controlled protein n=1 Tax=Eufriesea mexicana TaxID=516756 RepID=A0A310S8M6_9HYME|nr:PREDICTED: uncharacterized protein LOC108553139 [Eufriesea mexicana]OAD52998.1 hypothetical protein WN48_11084 [Eufriesea mexicana]
MRLLVAVLACVLVACQARVPNVNEANLSGGVLDTRGGQLVGFLEKFKDKLRRGDDHLGIIPVLDPLKQDHLDVNLDQEAVRLRGYLDNLVATGLSEYKVNRGDFTIIGIKANVSLLWEKIDIAAKYSVNGTLADYISVYGNGNLAISIQGLMVSVDLKLSVKDKKLFVSQLVLHARVQKMDCEITGLYNDEELSAVLSKAIGEILPGLIDDYQNELSVAASPLVADLLNDVLKNMTIKDLLDMISGGN